MLSPPDRCRLLLTAIVEPFLHPLLIAFLAGSRQDETADDVEQYAKAHPEYHERPDEAYHCRVDAEIFTEAGAYTGNHFIVRFGKFLVFHNVKIYSGTVPHNPYSDAKVENNGIVALGFVLKDYK